MTAGQVVPCKHEADTDTITLSSSIQSWVRGIVVGDGDGDGDGDEDGLGWG